TLCYDKVIQSSYKLYEVNLLAESMKVGRSSLVDQVAGRMEALIDAGEWPVGERIPTEMELADQFEVSRNTLREAIRALVHAGLLQTRQGSGTYVSSSSVLEAAIRKRVGRADV